MKKSISLTASLLLLAAASSLSSELDVSITRNLTSIPLAFTENQGQWDERVMFRADAGGATMWFTADGAFYQFTRRIESEEDQADPIDPMLDRLRRKPDSIETMMIKASFVGANPDPEIVGEGLLEYKCNYFLGNDPAKWRTDVANYSAVISEEVYPGIDLKYFGNGKEMEYDFIVSPGADPSQIRVQYEGVESLSVNADGELVVTTMWGEVIERQPVVYQVVDGNRVSLDGRYEIAADNSFGFSVSGNYNRSLPLVIDPVLEYSTYLGGSGYDLSSDVAVNASGEAYVTGMTQSTDFPTENPYQGTFQGGIRDVFVTKLSAFGNSLVYSTYLGGSEMDYGYAIAVDGSGSAYVTGRTESGDFPTENPYQNYQGMPDVFVTKLSAGGNSLIYSTYMGGSSNDYGYAIAVDISGAAYITGYTTSTSFPTLNAYQDTFQGGFGDAFITKLSTAGNSLVYSTYLGGNGDDLSYSIVVDATGAAYVTGFTSSDNFPMASPYQETHQGGYWDVFVVKLNAGGNSAVYSTYLGGSDSDLGYGIAVDNTGAAYVTGYTVSSNYPVQDPYQGKHQGDALDVFVTKLSASGDSLAYSTYLGGSGDDDGRDIAVDVTGAAYVTGQTWSMDFPTESGYQEVLQGSSDVFVTKLSAGGNSLVYSTYLGGSGDDLGYGIVVDAAGAAFVTGWTFSKHFPTVNWYQETLQGGGYRSDAFVSKLRESCCQYRGDIDHDGAVLPTDAVFFVDWLWRGGPEPPCLDEADVNGSESVDPQDCIYFVNYMWNGGPAPAPCP